MNIGIFTDTYYPQINGVATSACILERELSKLGHNVYIFTTTDPAAKQPEPRVYRLPSMPFIFLKTHRLALFYSPKLVLKIKAFKLDVVHTYTEFPLGFFGKLVSAIYHVPMVHTYHTMYEDYVHYIANGRLLTPKFAKRYSRMFCNVAGAVVAPVDKTRDYLLEIGVKKPIHIIPTGLDFASFEPSRFTDEELSAARAELGISRADRVVLTVGRVAKEKSMDVLVDMMPELLKTVPDAKLLIVGDGPVREELEARAGEIGVAERVVFAGFRPWETIGRYYCLSDAFATASTSETQGLTFLEAMAARVPVVVKRDPSFTGLIRHGETGFIFDSDADAAGTVAHALTHTDEAQRVTENGLKAIEPLSSAMFGVNMEKLYLSVLGEDAAPRG